jgi:hypothetical protein
VFAVLPCFSPDSARTKNPVATMTANQKINLAAFDIFMLLVLFWAPAFRISLFKAETQVTLCDSVPGYCTGASKKTQAECLT